MLITASIFLLLFPHLYPVSELALSFLPLRHGIILFWTCVNLFTATMKLYLFRMLDGSSYISGLNRGKENEQRRRMKGKSKVRREDWRRSFQQIHNFKLIYIFAWSAYPFLDLEIVQMSSMNVSEDITTFHFQRQVITRDTKVTLDYFSCQSVNLIFCILFY